MRRKAGALSLLLLAGCMSVETGPETGGGGFGGGYGGGGYGGGLHAHGTGGAPPAVPGMQGPWGQNIAMAPPYSANPPGAMAARAMLADSIPLDMVQMANGMPRMPGASPGGSMPGMIGPAGGMLSPPGVPFVPGAPTGSGIMQAGMPPGGADGGIVQASYPAGAVAALGALTNCPRFSVQRTQVQFRKPANMEVSWYTETPDGKAGYFEKIQTPGRYNFLQGAVYRLRLSKIPDRPLLEVYPTLEVVPTNSKTEAFLAHSAVPIEFTDEDFKQIAAGNYVEKVIYLPDPQYQELAGTGTEEILNTRLEPGANPIQEAQRRGSILLVIRIGNIFQELSNTPPMSAPGPQATGPMVPPPPGMPGLMVPYFGQPPMVTAPSGPIQISPPPPGMGGPAGPMGMSPYGPMAGPGGPMGMPPYGPMAGPGGPMMPPMAGPGSMMQPRPGFGPMPPTGMPPMGTPPYGPMPPAGNFGGPNGGLPPGAGFVGQGPLPPGGAPMGPMGPGGPMPGFGPVPPGFNGMPGGMRPTPPMGPNPGMNPGPFMPPGGVPGPGFGAPSSRLPDSSGATQQTGLLPSTNGAATTR